MMIKKDRNKHINIKQYRIIIKNQDQLSSKEMNLILKNFLIKIIQFHPISYNASNENLLSLLRYACIFIIISLPLNNILDLFNLLKEEILILKYHWKNKVKS